MPLATTKDYKRVFDGDRGPNTGGMGAHSPSVFVDAATARDVLTDIVHPTLRGMAEDGRPFRGVLYVGLMLENGLKPYVLEYNVRFGDPETQCDPDPDGGRPPAVPRRLGAGEARGGRKARLAPRGDGLPRPLRPRAIRARTSAGASSRGSRTRQSDPDVVVFHSGTARNADGKLVTSGGRVLSVCARARALSSALQKAREAAEKIRFEGKHFRRDIGKGPLELLRERSGAFLR